MLPKIGIIPSYGLFITLGVIAAFLFTRFSYVKLSRPLAESRFTEIAFGISALVGWGSSCLVQSLYSYIENPSNGFRITGFTFLGGLLGGAIAFVLCFLIVKKKLGEEFFFSLEVVPCSLALAHAFGRIGCFMAGCCYGKATDSWLGVVFPELGYKVYPTQLFESVFLFILFGILSALLFTRHGKFNFVVYSLSYGVFRFLIEFLRGDDRGSFIPGITPSQFWSLVLIVCGFVSIFIIKRKSLVRQTVAADVK